MTTAVKSAIGAFTTESTGRKCGRKLRIDWYVFLMLKKIIKIKFTVFLFVTYLNLLHTLFFYSLKFIELNLCFVKEAYFRLQPQLDQAWNLYTSSLLSQPNSFVIADLTPGQWYQIKVTAENAAGVSTSIYSYATTSVLGGMLGGINLVRTFFCVVYE